MNITVFGCSTSYLPYDGTNVVGKSYIDLLQEKHIINGIWVNGLNVFNVREEAKNFIRGNDRWIILHLGAVEAFTHPPDYLIDYALNNMLIWGSNRYFLSLLVKAKKSFNEKKEEYFHLIDVIEFERVYRDILEITWGSKVIIVGLGKPNTFDSFRQIQVGLYEQVLRKLHDEYQTKFVNLWNNYSEFIVDLNHLNDQGHKKIFNELEEIFNE